MKAEETMKEYRNKTRGARWEMCRFFGGWGGTRLNDAWKIRIGFIPLTFCWGQTILWASLRLTHLALNILVSSSEYQGLWIWEFILADSCCIDKLDLINVSIQQPTIPGITSNYNHFHPFSVLHSLCLWSYPAGSGSKRGLDYMNTYEYIFPLQSNQSVTSCLDFMGVPFKGFWFMFFSLVLLFFNLISSSV